MNHVGESWRSYYQAGQLSWYQPETVTPAYLQRWARSEWITRMLNNTGLQPTSNVRILEAGCGTATYAVTLALLGFSVDAFDYNQEALAIARNLKQRVEAAGSTLSLNLYQGNLLNIQAASNSYDLVFNQAVLAYFCHEAERKQALREMVRVTKPGGRVAVIEQHTGHPFRPLWEWLGWPGYTNQPPIVNYTPAHLQQELCQAGLCPISLDGIEPWKAFFFWPRWYQQWKWAHNLVYIVGQVLSRAVPMPRLLRRHIAVQILGVGRKP